MNRPHYVMNWTALDEEIDHCERFYQSNALAPIDRDQDAYWDGDERPTGFDFVEYRRAESSLLGTWEPPNDYRIVPVTPETYNRQESRFELSTRFEIVIDDLGQHELTTLSDSRGRPVAIQMRTNGRGYQHYLVRYANN